MSTDLKRVELYDDVDDKDTLDNLADLYSIIMTCEILEKAFIRDAVSAEDYTPACVKLIAQFKTCINSLGANYDIRSFVRDHDVKCPAAIHRLVEVGVPATTEHVTHIDKTSSVSNTKDVVESVQSFITLMDAIKIKQVAVDQLHPMLGDLLRCVNRIPSFKGDFDWKNRLKQWLIQLNNMRASEELSSEQSRQLLFDLENAHNAFCRAVSD